MKPLMLGLVAFGMAFAAMPSAAVTITGPASVEVRDVVSVGLGFCQADSSALPLFCDALPGSPGGSGAGAATFDSAWSKTDGNHYLRFDTDYNGEAPCVANPPCGYSVLVCNDRDLDSSCTNVGDQDDQLVNDYATGVLPATSTTVCFTPSVYPATAAGTLTTPGAPASWNNEDNFVVFIGVWAGAQGAGVSIGTYDVTMTDLGTTAPANPPSCTGGNTESTGCIWEADAVTAEDSVLDDVLTAVDALLVQDTATALAALQSGPVTGETNQFCADEAGTTSVFDCISGATLVVFQIGLVSTTATEVGSCGGWVSLTATGPLDVQSTAVAAPGGFTCGFDWLGAGVGGCIQVGP